VSVRVSVDARERGLPVPVARKPLIVHTLLDELGGAMDGALAARTTPVRLSDLDMELAVRCVAGEAGCRLPVVYVSVDQTGGHVLHVDALALALAGTAHVLVEPDRMFSMQLKHMSGSRNVYGGTIGVHWPDGNGRRPFFVPTVNGFCTMWRMEALQAIGFLDEETFPRGYGEEDDACLRALEAGYMSAVAPHLFAVHLRTQSFSHAEKVTLKEHAARMLADKYSERYRAKLVAYHERNPFMRQVKSRLYG
jgi:hypothetical protein